MNHKVREFCERPFLILFIFLSIKLLLTFTPDTMEPSSVFRGAKLVLDGFGSRTSEGQGLIHWLLCPPPNIATLGESRRANDFRSHPGVGAGSAHLGGAVPLTGQSKVGDLQCLVAEVFHLHPLKDEDWGSEEGGDERIFFCWLEMGEGVGI